MAAAGEGQRRADGEARFSQATFTKHCASQGLPVLSDLFPRQPYNHWAGEKQLEGWNCYQNELYFYPLD